MRGVRGFFLAIAVFLACLALYGSQNDFPYFYHSDEESKMLQVVQHYRNYWHPLLLVNATDGVARIAGKSADAHAVTRGGRFVSAAFAALAVAALTLLAGRRHGWVMAVATGLFLGTLPLLFELAHYLKEDTALLMGFALFALAADFWREKSGKREIAWLALACAVAASAKYVGFITLPLGLAAIWSVNQPGRLKFSGRFLLIFLAGLLAINWQWAVHPREVWLGLTRETHLLEGGHNGMAGSLPHWIYLEMFTNSVSRWMLVIAGLGAIAALRKSASRAADAGLLVFGIGYFLVLFYTAKASDRYLLPVIATCLYFFALGLVSLGNWLPTRLRPAVWIALILAAWWPQLTMLNNFRREFKRDSRGELVAWMRENLPPDARVATSLWTRLPGFYEGQFHGEPSPVDFVADRGSIAELRAAGFGYAVVADAECSRFVENGKFAESGSDAAFLRRRTFYHDLQAGRAPLWEKPLGRIYILHPGLRLYALPD